MCIFFDIKSFKTYKNKVVQALGVSANNCHGPGLLEAYIKVYFGSKIKKTNDGHTAEIQKPTNHFVSSKTSGNYAKRCALKH